MRAIVLSGLVTSAALLWSGSAVAQQRPAPEVHNYVAPGNLETTAILGCIELKDALPRYNSVDLFKSARACLKAHRWDDAVKIYTLALGYGRFDTLRVADSTAHQAIAVARMEIFGDVSSEAKQDFANATKKYLADGPDHAALCLAVEHVGPPSYYPRYMVQHGMGAFFGGKDDGLTKNFAPATAWQDVLTNYLKCPQPS